MAARAGFQAVAPSSSGGGGVPGTGALGPGTAGPPVRMGPAPGQGMYRSPLPGAAYPVPTRPGWERGRGSGWGRGLERKARGWWKEVEEFLKGWEEREATRAAAATYGKSFIGQRS